MVERCRGLRVLRSHPLNDKDIVGRRFGVAGACNITGSRKENSARGHISPGIPPTGNRWACGWAGGGVRVTDR